MANSAMVRSITRNVGSTSHNSTQSDHTVVRPLGAKHPLQEDNLVQLVAWNVSGKLWKVREYQNSLPHCRICHAIFNYESAWRKWAGWCSEREVNPFTSNIIEILEFSRIYL